MSTITTKDGTEIYYKDWGEGPAVTFSHGWPLSADAWDGQMLFLAQHGYRVVAHDRRGHGRSSQASSGNDMDGYADDLAAVMEALDLTGATLVGHSTGGGEVARYIGRHGTGRVAKAVLVAAVPPIMVKSAANPEGLPLEVFDGLRAGVTKDRSQFYKDLAIQFYGAFSLAIRQKQSRTIRCLRPSPSPKARQNAGVGLKLLGGLAVRVLTPDLPPRLRAGQDMDFACLSRAQGTAVFLEGSGCVPDRRFNNLNGDRQMYFTAPSGRPIDVMVDRLTMCHVLDFRPGYGR